MILNGPWRWFRTAGDDHVFYRCPECGAVIDWRDHEIHLRWHGVTMATVVAEIVKAQEEYVGLSKPRLPG